MNLGGSIGAKNGTPISTFIDLNGNERFYIEHKSAVIDYQYIKEKIIDSIDGQGVNKAKLKFLLPKWRGYKYYPNLWLLDVYFLPLSIDNSLMAYLEKENAIFINTKYIYYANEKDIDNRRISGREEMPIEGRPRVVFENNARGNGQREVRQADRDRLGKSLYLLRQSIRAKLFHELQHVIQKIEGIKISKSSPSYILSELKSAHGCEDMSDVGFKRYLEEKEGKTYDKIEYEFYIQIPSEKEALEVENSVFKEAKDTMKQEIEIKTPHLDKLTGGKADGKSIWDIAIKHNVSVDYAIEQLEKGIEEEKEHTPDFQIRYEIALDHLWENIEYYNRLKAAKLADGGSIGDTEIKYVWVINDKETGKNRKSPFLSYTNALGYLDGIKDVTAHAILYNKKTNKIAAIYANGELKEIMAGGGEITPHKEVSASVQSAIKDVLALDKYKHITPMEASMLYNKFKNYEELEMGVIYDKPFTTYKSDGLEKTMFENLDKKGLVSADSWDDTIELSGLGLSLIDSIRSRVATRKGVKAGTDLFPEDAGIAELKKYDQIVSEPNKDVDNIEKLANDVSEKEMFSTFVDIVKKADNLEDAYNKARQLKNVSPEIADAFYKKYNPNETETPFAAFAKFYREHRGDIPDVKPATPLKDAWKLRIENIDKNKEYNDKSELEAGDYASFKTGHNSFAAGFIKSIGKVNVIVESPYGGYADSDYKEILELKLPINKLQSFYKSKKSKSGKEPVSSLDKMVHINMDNYKPYNSISELRNKAVEYLKSIKGEYIYIPEKGKNIKVKISEAAINKMTMEAGETKLILTKQIKDILSQSIIHKVEHPNGIKESNLEHVLKCETYVMIKGKVYLFKFVVKMPKNETAFLYDGTLNINLSENDKTA